MAKGERVDNWGIITLINNQPPGSYDQVLALVKSKEPLLFRIQYTGGGNWQLFEYNKYELPGDDIEELVLQ